ncbi:DUF4124 domain-containing protein [Aliiglaciecola litoralis]|uniref:DUF4124 domain-containing protein n=1 Tax=Aliiglaciecola litoralis TaxID=582857 RepID=A0ABP3X289_9ALTE
MKILIVIIALILSATISATQLYKIVHADGSVTYTDTPQEGAVEVDMTKTNSVTVPALNTGNKTQLPAKRLEQKFPDYQLSIVSPQNQATLRNNQGKLTVKAQLSPVGNGKFELFLDGQLVQSSPAPSFQLQNVDRGEHKIQVKFIHHTGKILASSKEIVFFMHQASILINRN